MACIGKCTFQQLPQEYQELFTTGANRIKEGIFIAEKYPAAVLLTLPIFFLIAVVPAIVVSELGLSFLSLFGLLSLIPPVVMSVFAVKTIRAVIEVYRRKKEGVQIYGLIIDDKNVVMRELTIFTRKNCIFLPRTRIASFYLATEYNEARGTNRSSVLRLAYTDNQDKVKRLTLAKANTVELKPYQLHDLLLALNKTIHGEWSLFQPDFENHASDTIIRFNETDGMFIEFLHDEKITEVPFTYRPMDDRTILIETVKNKPPPFPQLEPGPYNYELKIEYRKQGKFYMVRFDKELAGSSLRSFGQKVGK